MAVSSRIVPRISKTMLSHTITNNKKFKFWNKNRATRGRNISISHQTSVLQWNKRRNVCRSCIIYTNALNRSLSAQVVQTYTGAMSTVTCSRVSSNLWRHWWSVSGRAWRSATASEWTGINWTQPARPTHSVVTSSTLSRPATESSRPLPTAATTTGGPTACRRPCRVLVVVVVVVTQPPRSRRGRSDMMPSVRCGNVCTCICRLS